ncbi:hypothetical protein MMYC01_204860 [Madurella mycetomatis]|uniref:F-box domain-containing protein n=1 Tax=Madurella mycetomatis TaxID=100816 RepID=A0A175W5B7_9PEZI|nr:hypothetical protein MMYC01_204860 [Madurella mycetomatis]
MASSGTPEPRASHSMAFMDLPGEVQAEVIRHCPTRDLVRLSLVSKHFHKLAAAELYRHFRIVFPDEDNLQFDGPVDALAGGFDTFVTSDYNYAQHLKTLCLDTLYMGDKAESAYRPYLASLSSGKFMNTLLCLILRRAKALESFKWNIRVELSRPVYNELHQIESLSHVHIRLQAGPSQFETPLPLPYSTSGSTTSLPPAHGVPISSLPPPPGFGPPPLPPPFYVTTTTSTALPIPKPPRAKTLKKTPLPKPPPTLSGFKKLKNLAVLDIDSLDIVPELKSCIRNSTGTLSKLKLSFSERLALLARSPSIDVDPEESDPEDDFQPLPPPPSGLQGDDVNGPARAFRVQEEKKTQEAVLGRIFDTEPFPETKNRRTRETDKGKEKERKRERLAKSEEEFVVQMKTYVSKLMGEVNGTDDLTASQDVLDMIGRAAQKYLDEAKLPKGNDQEISSGANASSSSTNQSPESTGAEASTETIDSAVSLFSQSESSGKAKAANKDVSPDDIDIEEPEGELSIDSQEPPIDDSPVNEPSAAPSEESSSGAARFAHEKAEYGRTLAGLAAQSAIYKEFSEKLEEFAACASQLESEIQRLRARSSAAEIKSLMETESQTLSFSHSIHSAQREVSLLEAESEHAERMTTQTADANTPHAHDQHMGEYLRKTRGIALQSLSIYLVPVKASVLSRAIDLRALRRLTLLNVGIQNPIWALLHKENKEAPLPLRKIFTDNVTPIFLNFVSGLEELHELFMLEREIKYRPESFAPRTEVTIDQIRKIALRRHLLTLRRLMIKNLADTAWDVDEKMVVLLCRQGRKLEELACNMSVRAMHTFMQRLAGLASLRALHIIQFRNDDTCVWVMRETKRFLIDNISHYPFLKLEWISIDDDDRAERLVRVAPNPEKKKKDEKNGKTAADGSKGKQKPSPMANMAMVEADMAGEDSESDDDDVRAQKIETFEGIPFCEVEGVRIFKKEIVAGKL